MNRTSPPWGLIADVLPAYIWLYNCPMEIVNFPPQYAQVGASGSCPHCTARSYLRPVATYLEQAPATHQFTVVSATQCESCKSFSLVVGFRPNQGRPCTLVSVFPLGKPDDRVDTNVPTNIAANFAEALRCKWINAFKACVVMCARAVQGSAIALGATKKKLTDQIDELFAQGKITEALKDFAHEIRVTRNLGAHPDKDGLEDVTEQDASDIIEFTREYLHHVYVMPAKLKARRPPPTAGTGVP